MVAGADVAMICHTFERQRGAVMQTCEAVEKGEWSVEELMASGERIKKLKERFVGSWDDVLGAKFDEQRLEGLKKHNSELSKTAYAACIALINGPLPKISKEDKVLVLTPEMQSLDKAVDDDESVQRAGHNTAGSSCVAFASAVARRVSSSQHIVYSSEKASPSDIKAISVVIFVTRNADRSPWQIDQLRYICAETAAPVVLLQSCRPYDLLSVEVSVPSLASFEFTPPALEAAAGVLFGEIEARGRVPVLSGRVVG